MQKRTVLVTGAAGFIGRYVIAELLEVACGDIKEEGIHSSVYYDRIIALDMISPDEIAATFQYSHRVLPFQFDLQSMLSDNTFAVDCLRNAMRGVDSVIHIAGIVDTRENPITITLLDRVNVQVTTMIVDIAEACKVSRFVHISSASACIKRKGSPSILSRLFLGVFGLNKSMLSSLDMSSYGKTKLAGERYVLSKAENKSPMVVCVVRPHVVWGRGDTLSTEVLINWNPRIPDITIGVSESPVVSGRVDVVASYIVLADKMLSTDNAASLSGDVFDVGDTASTLGEIHSRIASCRRYKDISFEDVTKNGKFLTGDTLTPGRPVKVYTIPHFIAVTLIVFIEWLQYICFLLKIEFILSPFSNSLRLLTLNNYAYTCHDLVTCPNLDSFDEDCQRMYFQANGISKKSKYSEQLHVRWKQKMLSDEVILCKDWLNVRIAKCRLDDSLFNLPMKYTVLADSCMLGPIKMTNRVIKAATYECMATKDGVPTDELGRFHARVAKGGAGMTIVAYGSVSNDGRSFPTQICLKADDPDIARKTEEALTKLCHDVHAARDEALVALQITHAGAFADPSINAGRPPRGPSAILNPLTLKYSVSLDKDYEALQRIENDFVDAVDYCRKVGFDAVEIHLGHGYLLS